ncbi:hypothetical protein TTHERM_00151490 (macronuclear) [Tetrahymena thermophila SB210]|uniref:Uncharacterized protein n=1 Tax=Tetrahymena thermophila (strain SB210) TaxID=312017 RepID=I7ML98_TETTS|nr:hypothetical protein TTHERM_00151490 [Tetrahymena thermophila SB210]EAS01439.1 hypothetical protein TTHERM_00151490 [Tetrahymena thermophila SB210]|eukprot:XP_001021685.1 hypothetical protein TTHERM_00151490 [Tetrahymena thermophila SB210]
MEPSTPNYNINNHNHLFSSFDSNKSLGENQFNLLDDISCFTSNSTQNNLMIESSQLGEETVTEENMAVLRSILQNSEEVQFDSEMEDRIFSWLDLMNIHITQPSNQRRKTANFNLLGRQKSSLLTKRKQSTMN